MTPRICPSILSCNPASYLEPVREMEKAGVDWIHLDVMDGQFVPPITFGADLAAELARSVSVPLEAHLMTETPDQHFEAFIGAGCQRITFHAEAHDHAHRLCQSLRSRGVQAGVAVNPGTPVEALIPLLEVMDLALIMTVNPGWGGQSFLQSCLAKVEILRQLKPDLAIQVDGGIDPSTIGLAERAGATEFVTGSYLMKAASIAEGVESLRRACTSSGSPTGS